MIILRILICVDTHEYVAKDMDTCLPLLSNVLSS